MSSEGGQTYWMERITLTVWRRRSVGVLVCVGDEDGGGVGASEEVAAVRWGE